MPDKSEENGIPVALRDDRGRLLPGSNLNPSGRGGRRQELQYVAAIKEALPPDEVQGWVDKALQIAVAQNSWRGIAAVLELALAYGVGKPTQRIQHSDGNLEELMQLLRQGPGSVDAMLGSSSSSSGSGSGSKPTVADSSSSSNGSSSGSGE